MEEGSRLLEQWLLKVTSSRASSPSPSPSTAVPTAARIAHAWSTVRLLAQPGSTLDPDRMSAAATALAFLSDLCSSLHIADSQAALLFSILSSAPNCQAALVARLLATWARKAARPPPALPRMLEPACPALLLALGEARDVLVCPALLLLGVLSAAPNVPLERREACRKAVAKVLVENPGWAGEGRVEEGLAGLGYALVSSSPAELPHFMHALLSVWSNRGTAESLAPRLQHSLMVLHLVEWCARSFLSQPGDLAVRSIQVMVEQLEGASMLVGTVLASLKCTVLMGAAGLLRCLQSRAADARWHLARSSLELLIANSVDELGGKQVEHRVDVILNSTHLKETLNMPSYGSLSCISHWLHKCDLVPVSGSAQHWLQCAALALARCKGFPCKPSVSLCLLSVLLTDVLPLAGVYTAQIVVDTDADNSKHGMQSSHYLEVLNELRNHVESTLFHEAGSLSRALCEHYRYADYEWQLCLERMMWEYSVVLYESHRHFTALNTPSKESGVKASLESDGSHLQELLNTAFLLVVMFSSSSFSSRRQENIPDQALEAPITKMIRMQHSAARILDSLSCLEFFRQVQVPDFGSLIKDCLSEVASHETATMVLIDFLPSYEDVTNLPGSSRKYDWAGDNVQTSRMLFYFRILPSCLESLPDLSFADRVAPLMFLYLQHPFEKVHQASHNLFRAFFSTSGTDSRTDTVNEENLGCTLQEQLVPYYVERILETFPGLTSFENVTSGIASVIRYLPPGSPAKIYCIDSLVEKTTDLYRGTSIGGTGKQVEEEKRRFLTRDDSDPTTKLYIFLLHLVLLVDIQMLPYLLKAVAKLILGLPVYTRKIALGQAFDVLASTDDFCRKPLVVPWLQTLLYLCSHQGEIAQSAVQMDGEEPSTLSKL